jgi:hypothetical protein
MAMLLRSLFLAVALLFASLSSPGFAMTVVSPYGASFEAVPQLLCVSGPHGSAGSGVRINENTILTAAHVPSGKTCLAWGTKLTNTRFEPGQDVAFVTSDSLKGGLRMVVSCEGIKEGQRYLAMGYADGGAADVETLIGTSDRSGELTVMRGHVYHGMSGGAVLNEAGAVVAVVNAMQAQGMPLAFVTPLTQTYLCKGGA